MNLRTRIALVLMLVTVVLCLLFSGAIIMTGYDVEDRVLEQHLQVSIDALQRQRAVDPTVQPIAERAIRGWVDLQTVPEPFRSVFAKLPTGKHEWLHNETMAGVTAIDQHDRLLAVSPLADGATAYFVFDTWMFEDEGFGARQVWPLILASIAGVLVVVIVAYLVVDRWIVRRLQSLGQRLDRDDTADGGMTDLIVTDEVGRLAERIQAYQRRIDGFLARERRLVRDVSHELRTPITIIRGALDVLDYDGELASSRPLQRIRRASETMAMLAEAFLVTAREEQDNDTTGEVGTLLQQRCEALQPLAEAQGQTLDCTISATVPLQALAAPVTVVIDNLLRNAIEHGTGPVITIRMDDQGLTVVNACTTSTPDSPTTDGAKGNASPGYGFGLGIADEFARRLDWRLEIDASAAGTFTVYCRWGTTGNN